MELCEVLAAASAAGSVSDMSPSLEKLEALVASGEVRDAEPWPARLCETLAGLLRAWGRTRAPKAAMGGAARASARSCVGTTCRRSTRRRWRPRWRAVCARRAAALRVRSPDDERPRSAACSTRCTRACPRGGPRLRRALADELGRSRPRRTRTGQSRRCSSARPSSPGVFRRAGDALLLTHVLLPPHRPNDSSGATSPGTATYHAPGGASRSTSRRTRRARRARHAPARVADGGRGANTSKEVLLLAELGALLKHVPVEPDAADALFARVAPELTRRVCECVRSDNCGSSEGVTPVEQTCRAVGRSSRSCSSRCSACCCAAGSCTGSDRQPDDGPRRAARASTRASSRPRPRAARRRRRGPPRRRATRRRRGAPRPRAARRRAARRRRGRLGGGRGGGGGGGERRRRGRRGRRRGRRAARRPDEAAASRVGERAAPAAARAWGAPPLPRSRRALSTRTRSPRMGSQGSRRGRPRELRAPPVTVTGVAPWAAAGARQAEPAARHRDRRRAGRGGRRRQAEPAACHRPRRAAATARRCRRARAGGGGNKPAAAVSHGRAVGRPAPGCRRPAQRRSRRASVRSA